MDDLAREDVRLVPALGVHDPDAVDAYYGPVDPVRTRMKLSTPVPCRASRRRLPARVAVLAFAAVALRCGAPAAQYTPEEAARARTTLETVQMRDIRTGPGEPAEPGRRLVVHYSGWLYDSAAPERRGKPFDSSRTSGRPFDFVLGAGQVIPGWERGVAGMKEGGVRELTIPARLAYGADGSAPVIPPDATLVFEIELMDVR